MINSIITVPTACAVSSKPHGNSRHCVYLDFMLQIQVAKFSKISFINPLHRIEKICLVLRHYYNIIIIVVVVVIIVWGWGDGQSFFQPPPDTPGTSDQCWPSHIKA